MVSLVCVLLYFIHLGVVARSNPNANMLLAALCRTHSRVSARWLTDPTCHHDLCRYTR